MRPARTICVLPILFAVPTLGQTSPPPPPPLDTCTGAMGTVIYDHVSGTPLGDIHLACGSDGERSPGTGKCASTACAALVDSFTDANMELMARGFASCTGDDALWLGHYADVGHLKNSLIKPVADDCGLTATFSLPGLDSCLGAIAALDSDKACGSWEERTPGTGACASAACTTFFDNLTDANVELMTAGLASCTGDFAVRFENMYASGGSGYMKLALKSMFASCGRTAPFPQEPLDTCLGAIEEVMKFNTECGPEDARTPGTGECASVKCYDHMDSFTDAKVQLIVTAMNSCPSGLPDDIPYSAMDSVYAKNLLTRDADSCGLSPPFTPETYGPGSVGGVFLLKVQDGCGTSNSPTDNHFVDMRNWIKRADVETRVVNFGSTCKAFMTSCYPAATDSYIMYFAATGCPDVPPHLNTLRRASQLKCEADWNSLKGLDDFNAIKAMIEQHEANGVIVDYHELSVLHGPCNPVAALTMSSDCGQIFSASEFKIIGVESSAGDVAGSCETCGNDAASCPPPPPSPPLPHSPPPPPSPTPPASSASEDDPSLKLGGSAQQAEDTGANVGAAVGGAVGGVAALAVVTGVVVYCYRKKKAQAAKPQVAGVEVQSVKDEHI